jgi:phosphoribosylanthranilate isomerase
MNRVRVKVCGITRVEDALAAVRLGADAIGFVFWPASPRAVTSPQAAAIADALPAFVVRVGVFVNASPSHVARVVRETRLTAVQLHGDEDVAVYAGLPVPVVKAVALETDADVVRAARWPASVTPLVDAVSHVERGGTGRVASWDLAATLAQARPVILAGGLTSGNVAEAIRVVRPWAVDVSSGVECAPGVKDHGRLEAFFAALRA